MEEADELCQRMSGARQGREVLRSVRSESFMVFLSPEREIGFCVRFGLIYRI